MNRKFLLLLVIFTLAIPLLAQEEDEEDQPDSTKWHFTIGAKYLSHYVTYGVDLSDGRAAFQPSLKFSHASGASAGFNTVRTLGSDGALQQWTLNLGYEHPLTSWLTGGVDFSHTKYQSDTVNILASLANSVTVSLDAEFDPVSVGVSYDRFFGSAGASYLGLTIAGTFEWGDVIVMPMIGTTWMSQDVQTALLRQNKGQGKSKTLGSLTTSVTGMSSLSLNVIAIYPLGHGFMFTLSPSFLYSPKAEVSSSSSQLLFTAGISYGISW
jgi:hypothetical protein